MNARIFALSVLVLVTLDSTQGWGGMGFPPLFPNYGPQNNPAPSRNYGPLGIMMGMQPCGGFAGALGGGAPRAGPPPTGSRAPGAPRNGMSNAGGPGAVPGRQAAPGAPAAPMSPAINPLFMGAMDIPDAPDFGFGCFCRSGDCAMSGLMFPDPVCSAYYMCCSCDGMMDFGL